MSDNNFVSRWSRLKREAAAQDRKATAEAEPASDVRPDVAQDKRISEATSEARKAEPEIDLASLPPIDSIVGDTDIRGFLQKGVPAELAKAALRRAWSSDPAIRDFIGLAENQWDFTDPTAIPGFGPLQAVDNVGQLVAQAMGRLADGPDTVGLLPGPIDRQKGADPQADAPKTPAAPSEPPDDQQSTAVVAPIAVDAAATQHAEPTAESEGTAGRKGHGRALPR
jgi:hypothetical protein